MRLIAVASTVLILASTGLIESAARIPGKAIALWRGIDEALAGLHFHQSAVSQIAAIVFLFAAGIAAVLLLTGRRDRSRLVVRLARRGRPMPALARRTGWSQDAVRTLIRLEGYERDRRYPSGKFFRAAGNSRLKDRFSVWASGALTGYKEVN